MVEMKITSVHEGNGKQFTVAPVGVITDVWLNAADGYSRVNLGSITELTPPKDVIIVNGVTQESK